MSARRPISIFPLEEGPLSVELHPNDRTMLLTYETRLEVRLTATGEKVWGSRFAEGLAGAVFAKEGRSVIAAAMPEKWEQRHGGVSSAERDLVRVSEDEARRSLDVRVSSVLAASPDGATALLHYGDGELGLFDLHALAAKTPFVLAERAVLWTLRSGAVSRDGEVAITSTRKGVPEPPVNRLEVWHPAGGSGVRGRGGNAGGEGPVAASPNGKYVLYGSGRNAVLWNVGTGGIESPMSVDALAHDVSVVEFESDGRRFLYGGGDRVEVVKRLPGKTNASLLHEPAGAAASVRCARFSHDGRRVVTAAADGRVFLWDVS